MRLANFAVAGTTKVGVIEGGRVYDLEDQDSLLPKGSRPSNVDALLEAGALGGFRPPRLDRRGRSFLLGKVKLQTPVMSPRKILLAAVNYVAHGKEQSVKPPSEPYFFTKFANTLVADGDPILIPRISSKVDWEVELAAIIGKKGKYIPKSRALDYVAGFAVSNDVSFRDLQFWPGWPKAPNALGQNWLRGKGLDSSFPLGPWLVTPDEVGDLGNLHLTLKVNGKVMQKASTSDMVFGVDDLVSYLSQGLTLYPGDVISTGTPPGVAVFTGAPYLKDGDIVEASVSRIGTLTNPVRADDRTRRRSS